MITHGSTWTPEAGRLQLGDLAARKLDEAASVSYEPGVFIIVWDTDRKLPIPEYLVARQRTDEIEGFFEGALRLKLPNVARVPVSGAEQCGKSLECGSTCCLRAQHLGGCECGADAPGEPGTCPA